ncbi:MAG: glycosyltransferase family 4 protein [Bacteroidota bacterium]
MKILQITNRVPYPPKDGGAIGYYNFTKSYYDTGCDVILLAMNTSKHYINISSLPESFTKFAKIHTVNINNKIRPFSALKNIFSSKSYNIERFESVEFENELIQILKSETFDVIHLDSLYVSMYISTIRKHSNAKVVMRAHNVEHLIWERIADVEKNPLKKWYLSLLAKRLKKYEQEAINLVDLLLPISQFDKEYLIKIGCNVKQYIVPAGIDTEKFIVNKEIEEFPNLFHLGSLDWIPNQQAITWFLNSIWPLINKTFPELKFFLAGRNAPKWILDLEIPNVEIIGEVENAVDFINSKSIMIVPLLSGSGMRLKILEGMALAKAIISTSIGAEGIEYKQNENILIANTPEEFIESIQLCLNNKKYFLSLGRNARILAEEKYDNNRIVLNLIDYYKKFE